MMKRSEKETMENKKDWWKKSVVYQIYPRSFYDSDGDGLGDLKGISEKIPYLKKLGIDVILMNPICVSPQIDNGYDMADYRAVDTRFGTMADFDELIEHAHHEGIKIMIDMAFNHSSSQHPWFMQAKTSRDNPYHDYYIWKDRNGDKLPNNWGSSFGGSAWEYVKEVDQYYLHCFAKEQPDLNWENPKVRKEIYDILHYWLKRGVDGFRLDVITLISKDPAYPDGPVIQNKAYGSYYAGCATGPRAHEFIHEMNQEVFSKYDCIIVGEAPHTGADEAMAYTRMENQELQMVFHFDHMHLDYGENGKYCRNRYRLTELKEVMSRWQDKMRACNGWNALYWSNPDQARPVTRFGDERKEYREMSAKMLGTVLYMMQGTPYIYEGEELGMTNAHFTKIEEYKDLEALDTYKDFTERRGISKEETLALLRLKSRDNARTPMQWDDSQNAGFTQEIPWIHVNSEYKEINAAKSLEDQNSVFYYYQKLNRLRHEEPVITEGKYELFDADNEKVYAYLRKTEKECMIVICNFTEESILYQIPDDLCAKNGSLMISNDKDAKEKLGSELLLAPYGAYVYLKSN